MRYLSATEPVQDHQGAKRRLRVLFFGEGVSLAHVGRPLALAGALDTAKFELHFATAERYRPLVSKQNLAFHPAEGLGGAAFMKRLARGSALYDAETLQRCVNEDLHLLRTLKPDLVVGDFRVSLGISAEALGVPHVNLCNAHWSPHAELAFPVPDLPVVRLLGERLGGLAVRAFAPLVMRKHAESFNRLRRAHGLAPVLDLREMYTHGTWTLWLDLPELVPMRSLPVNQRFLGPVSWSPAVPLPDRWQAWRDGRPLVYATLGSSGDAHALPALLRALATLPVQACIATAGRKDLDLSRLPANVFAEDFLPGAAVLAQADACVFNGGAATGYQALAAGVPVLGLPSNADQFFHAQAVAASGAGLWIRARSTNAKNLHAALRQLLEAPQFCASARRLASAIHARSAEQAFCAFMEERLMHVARASNSAEASPRPKTPAFVA